MTKPTVIGAGSDSDKNWAPVLPIALRINGRRCVVVGGGPVGTRKVSDLRAGAGIVEVISPVITPELQLMVDQDPLITWTPRRFELEDLDGAFVVITATGCVEVDAEIFAACEASGILINSADDPDRCNFFLTALVRRDPVVVSITTAGNSPALAAYLRRRLESVLEQELGDIAMLLRARRSELRARGVSTESLGWSDVLDEHLIDSAVAGDWDLVTARINSLGALR